MDPKQEAHYKHLRNKYGDWQELATMFKRVYSKQKKDKLVTIDILLPMHSFSSRV